MHNCHFEYSLDFAPIFFTKPSHQEQTIFTKNFNALVRTYYKLIRKNNGNVNPDTIIGQRFGIPITAGEVAILLIREHYFKRKI
jgi:hypothetical protein